MKGIELKIENLYFILQLAGGIVFLVGIVHLLKSPLRGIILMIIGGVMAWLAYHLAWTGHIKKVREKGFA